MYVCGNKPALSHSMIEQKPFLMFEMNNLLRLISLFVNNFLSPPQPWIVESGVWQDGPV